MPSTSKKQHNFMAAIAHNPAFAKKVGVSQAVGKDFNEADKSRKFKQGGSMKSDMKEDMKMDKSQDKAMIKKAFKQHDSQEHKGGKGTNLTLKKGGMPMIMKDGKKMPAFAAKTGGMTKMAKGGMAGGKMVDSRMMAPKMGGSDRAGRAMASPSPDMMGRAMPRRPMAAEAAPMMAKGGGVKKMAYGGMAKGGGIESKGKTQGKMVKMNRGGRSC